MMSYPRKASMLTRASEAICNLRMKQTIAKIEISYLSLYVGYKTRLLFHPLFPCIL